MKYKLSLPSKFVDAGANKLSELTSLLKALICGSLLIKVPLPRLPAINKPLPVLKIYQ
jgi:hypothetical protein